MFDRIDVLCAALAEVLIDLEIIGYCGPTSTVERREHLVLVTPSWGEGLDFPVEVDTNAWTLTMFDGTLKEDLPRGPFAAVLFAIEDWLRFSLSPEEDDDDDDDDDDGGLGVVTTPTPPRDYSIN